MSITTKTHPHEATVTGDFVYYKGDKEFGRVPFSITIADNCCEDHAEIAAQVMARVAADGRAEVERPFGATAVRAVFHA